LGASRIGREWYGRLAAQGRISLRRISRRLVRCALSIQSSPDRK
jgi:hypothetical protein